MLWLLLLEDVPFTITSLGAPFVAAGIMYYVWKRPHLWQCTLGGKR